MPRHRRSSHPAAGITRPAVEEAAVKRSAERSPTTAEVYDRAGFGRRVQRGSRPAVIVVDFTFGFTDPQYPTGADMSSAVLATARVVEAARAAGLPVVFTTIAYDAAQVTGL